MICIVMGISGSGKTTIGQLLARHLNLPFFDADDFHSAANKHKMREGSPLTDLDRKDWLESLAASIQNWENDGGAVLACSALKESYRIILQSIPRTKLRWIFLEGDYALIQRRIKNRNGHFMHPKLLHSQLDTLEKPDYGIHIDINHPPSELVQNILRELKNMKNLSEFGLIGLGVMGKSISLNLAEKGIRLSIYNRHVSGSEEGIAKNVVDNNPNIQHMHDFDDLAQFIASLERPRKIMMMITAGPAVDMQLESLLPLLDPEDVIIDGGNSFYKDTARRTRFLGEKGIEFVGVGISGGEEGARLGPSLMPGGSQKGYTLVKHYLELIAAKDKNGIPCSTYVGPEGAGHFIKMIHNSIEYAEMQLLSECYQLLRVYLKLSPDSIADTFKEWQEGHLNSYLLGITSDIMNFKEDGDFLLDKILDQAEQKGTGSWAVNAALENSVPYGPLTEAVMARALSSQKDIRTKASTVYNYESISFQGNRNEFLERLKKAYQSCRILNHHIGFELMREISDHEAWSLNLSEVARIWTRGCIIRSKLMENLVEIYKEEQNLLLAPPVVKELMSNQRLLVSIVTESLNARISLPVFSSALNYFYAFQTANSPANLIQAQRDYFGAHTYQRTDSGKQNYFHTNWEAQ